MSQVVESLQTDLELDEDIKLHKKGWAVQRVGWILMFAFVILAALGFFGDGVLSKTHQLEGNTHVEYDHFFRHEARMQMTIDMISSDTNVQVSFPNEYLNNFRIESIQPEPAESSVANGLVHYAFSGSGKMNIVFYLVPQNMGTIKGSVTVDDNSFPVSHFIYP